MAADWLAGIGRWFRYPTSIDERYLDPIPSDPALEAEMVARAESVAARLGLDFGVASVEQVEPSVVELEDVDVAAYLGEVIRRQVSDLSWGQTGIGDWGVVVGRWLVPTDEWVRTRKGRKPSVPYREWVEMVVAIASAPDSDEEADRQGLRLRPVTSWEELRMSLRRRR